MIKEGQVFVHNDGHGTRIKIVGVHVALDFVQFKYIECLGYKGTETIHAFRVPVLNCNYTAQEGV